MEIGDVIIRIRSIENQIDTLKEEQSQLSLQLESHILSIDDVDEQLRLYLLVEDSAVKYRLYKHLREKIEYREE